MIDEYTEKRLVKVGSNTESHSELPRFVTSCRGSFLENKHFHFRRLLRSRASNRIRRGLGVGLSSIRVEMFHKVKRRTES